MEQGRRVSESLRLSKTELSLARFEIEAFRPFACPTPPATHATARSSWVIRTKGTSFSSPRPRSSPSMPSPASPTQANSAAGPPPHEGFEDGLIASLGELKKFVSDFNGANTTPGTYDEEKHRGLAQALGGQELVDRLQNADTANKAFTLLQRASRQHGAYNAVVWATKTDDKTVTLWASQTKVRQARGNGGRVGLHELAA